MAKKRHRTIPISLFLHSGVIARWLLKTACTFGAKMSVEVPEQIRRNLYQDTVPIGISVDMAHNKQLVSIWPCLGSGMFGKMKS